MKELTNNKKILVIGAGKQQYKTIKLVKQLGYYCLCVDGDPGAPGFEIADEFMNIDVLDIDACFSYAKAKEINGVITTSATITLPAVAKIAKEMNLIGIDPSVVNVLKSKYEIKKTLFMGGLNNPGFFTDISTPDLLERAKEQIQYPSIIKPSDGSGSKGISVVNRISELVPAVDYAMESSRINNIYIEPFVDGAEYGVECFVFKGEITIYGVIKQTFKRNPDGKIEYGHCIPTGLSNDVENSIKKEATKAIKCLGINHGSVNMDLILTKENVPYIIDIGARIGLNQIAERLVPLATGVDLLANTIKASVNDEASFKPMYLNPVASRLLILKPGIVKCIGDYRSLIDGKNVLDIILNIKPGDNIRPYKIKSDTCGWIITTSNSVEEAEQLANTIRDKIERLVIYERENSFA
ncbi:ATP-grasp domain-containing protein [Virgibacillus natechei]